MYRICIKGIYLYNKTKTTMKKAFKIYKQGTTQDWVTILIPSTEFTKELLQFKIDKYLSLGYQIEMI